MSNSRLSLEVLYVSNSDHLAIIRAFGYYKSFMKYLLFPEVYTQKITSYSFILKK